VVAACLGSGAGARAGDEGARDLTPEARWKVGDVLTRTEKVTIHVVDRIGGKGYSSGSSDNTTSIASTWLEECREVDANGARTAYRAYVKAWARTEKKVEDTSLQGKFVDVRGTGAGRAWTIDGAAKAPSEGAHEFLESAFGPGERDNPVVAMLPEGPVAPGATWKPPMERLVATALGSLEAAVASRGEGSVTFRAVEDDRAAIAWDVRIPSPRLPVRGDRPWSKGGTWRLQGTAVVVPDARVGAAEESWSLDIEGEGIIKPEEKGNGPLVYELEIASTFQRTRALGGEMPKPEAAPR
jgi:hypothetical protein